MEPASVTIKKKRALRLAFSVVVGLRFSLSCGGPWCGHRSDDDRPVAQARRGADGRQEGRERGYYHLHRQLDDALLLHTIFVFFSVVRWRGGQPLSRLEARDYSGGGWSALRVISSPPELGGEPDRAGWSERALLPLANNGAPSASGLSLNRGAEEGLISACSDHP